MTIYNDVFGGANIYPSDISYSQLNLLANAILSWPEETSAAGYFATRIIDVETALDNKTVFLPPATGAGVGETVMFNNIGSKTVTVADYTGVQVASLAPGTVWQVYLTENNTVGGTWVSLQYGAAVSTANASALAGTGIVAVGTALSQSIPIVTLNSWYTAGINDRAKMFVWQGGVSVMNLPPTSAVGNNWFLLIRNSGSGAYTARPYGPSTIDGLASLVFQPGESAILVTDGSNYYSIGFGQSAAFAFDYTTVDLTGLTTYALSSAEYNKVAYSFFGTLGADCVVTVPGTVQQYWVTNNTTGGFSIEVKTAVGTGITIGAAKSSILYCNGVDVVLADTGGISLPLAVAQGGTGAISSSGALINLGGSSVGIAMFTAADPDAVWSTLGNPPLISGGTF